MWEAIKHALAATALLLLCGGSLYLFALGIIACFDGKNESEF